jgi:response regulator of citrate/malate metabolism
MTNAEIAVFLEDTRLQIQHAIDEGFRPKYKSNTWLKQKDLNGTQRIIMSLMDEVNAPMTVKDLVNLTGFSRKSIRENLELLKKNQGIVNKIENSHSWETIKIW